MHPHRRPACSGSHGVDRCPKPPHYRPALHARRRASPRSRAHWAPARSVRTTVPPRTPAPTNGMHCLTRRTSESPDAPSLAAWWTSLNDPTLNELIERALAENKTVQAGAGPRRRSACPARRRGRRFLSDGRRLRRREPHRLGIALQLVDAIDGDLTAQDDEVYTAGLDARWELDLFGGKRRAFEAATANWPRPKRTCATCWSRCSATWR